MTPSCACSLMPSQIKRQTVTVREPKVGGQVVLTISALEDER